MTQTKELERLYALLEQARRQRNPMMEEMLEQEIMELEYEAEMESFRSRNEK